MPADANSARSFRTSAIVITVLIAMYVGAEFLQPVALAILLAFILGPLVRWFERWGLPTVMSAILTLAIAFAGLGTIGYVVANEFTALSSDLPKYELNIERKIHEFRLRRKSSVEKVREAATRVGETLAPEGEKAPTPVRVASRWDLLENAETILGPFRHAVAKMGIVLLLLFFVLLEREQVHDRIVRLAGRARVGLSTKTLRQAGERLSRYLMSFAAFNTGFGTVIGVGLYFIGMPGALFWGSLAALLRFVPYLGPATAIASTCLFSVAFFPGWREPALVLLLFIAAESVANSIEPYIYGRSTGLSALSLLLAALFWTWLWGPLGLLLSTPLTVCLHVLGRYIPSLGFLTVLLGEEVDVDTDLRWYQRVLHHDQDGAVAILDEALEHDPPETAFDQVIIPALHRAQEDRREGYIDRADQEFLWDITQDWLDDLADQPERSVVPLPTRAATPGTETVIVGVAISGRADVLVFRMVNLLLAPARAQITIVDAEGPALALSDQIVELHPSVIVPSFFPSLGMTHLRYLVRRLHARLPDVPLVLGLWDSSASNTRVAEQLRPASVHRIVTSVRVLADSLLEHTSEASKLDELLTATG